MGIANPSSKHSVALIAGPTASGKTALALWLAQRHDSIIINADSAQVYKNLPILSAQPSPDEMASAPHRLFGYLDGDDACSAVRWAEDAKREITHAHANGKLPILVGGTGLYFRTLLEGIAPVSEIDPDIRATVRALSTEEALAALIREDAIMAAKLEPNDGNRIKRALEVIRSTGRSLHDWRSDKKGGIAEHIHLHSLILLPPRDWLRERCDQRFERMMEEGAVEEVEALLALNLPDDAPVMRAIGVPEIAAMLNSESSREMAIALGQAATRQYAKRQYTWFRNQGPKDWPRWNEKLNKNNIDEVEILFQF
jgi:tRNA dimethylallyltransferase